MTQLNGPIARDVSQPFEAVLAKLPALLQAEGFGVITEIDLQKTFAAKLGVTFRRYQILGACNPRFAYQAVSASPEVGVMLPCNIAVYELEDGGTHVVAVDPIAQIAGGADDLTAVATEVRQRLERVIAAV